ncbi:tetratricopeptide repeat protein [bacterium]|nr:tetratricopeptide repeat protein [bacterium]
MKYLLLFILSVILMTGCGHIEQRSGLAIYAEGILHEKADKKEDAINSYKKALRHQGESSYIYVKLGNLYVKDKNVAEAKRSFFRALRIAPNNHEAMFGLGVAYLLEKNEKLAATYIEKGLTFKPDNQAMRVVLCDLLVALNRLDDARVQYEFLLEEFPNNYLLYFNYGTILEKMGLYDKAEEAFLSSVQLVGNFWKSTLSLALLYSKQNRQEEAMKYFRKATSLNPQDNVSYSFLASFYYRAGEKEETKALLREALNNGIRNIEFYNLLGNIFLEETNYPKAEEYFRQSIALLDNVAARFYLGIIYDKLDMYDKMEEEMKKALELEPDNALTLNYLGYSYLLKDINLQEALSMIKKACSIEPDNGAFLDSLGWAYYKLGNFKRAKGYLEQAVLLENDAEVYEHLGLLYFELKEYNKSLLWLIKAYDLEQSEFLLNKIEEVKQKIKNGIN